jgi:hypothetical protein
MNTTTLVQLHEIIQISMGWTNSHLHHFIIGDTFYSDPLFELERANNERRATLASLGLEPASKFSYEYDFGDSWVHTILIEKVLPPEPNIHYPYCLKGSRSGPPEDCGGIWGYMDLLEILKDPDDPEYEGWKEWPPEGFDPTAFDLKAINQQLQAIQ